MKFTVKPISNLYFLMRVEFPSMALFRHTKFVIRHSLTAFMLMLIFPAASYAATLTVTKTADTNDGVCDADCSLREAIIAANSAPTEDIVNFDPTTFNSSQIITLGGSELTIGSNTHLTINGPGPDLLTITANDQSRILFVGGSAVVNINGLRFTGGNGVGNDSSHGGGIRLFNFTVTNLNNVVITGNRTPGQGGGLFVANSTLTIANSVVSNNRAASSAGGIFMYESTLTLLNSSVTGNPQGGGIQNSGGALNLQSSTVADNFTAGDGGGIDNGGGTVTIDASIISGNIGRQGGGGISGTNGSIRISNSTITNNRAEFFGGGGIKSYGRLAILGSTIKDNTAINSEGGGGIYNRASLTTVEIRNSIISGNSTTGAGGGILNDGEGINDEPSLRINNCLIIANTATGKGGGILNGGHSLFYNLTIIANASMSEGGGIANVANTPIPESIITNVTIVNNRASNGGGVDNPGFFYPRNSIVANNIATGGSSNDWSGFVDSFGYNLIKDITGAEIVGPIQTGNIFGLDPRLGPLKDNGGPTPTLALRPGSPAIDKGAFVNPVLLEDQRGLIRPIDFDSIPNAIDGNASDIGAYERQTNDVDSLLTLFDYDGDGKSDPSVFRATDGTWYVSRSGLADMYVMPWGLNGDNIVPADYDGDGKTDLAVRRPADNNFYIFNSSNSTMEVRNFGITGDIAVPSDYNGDGKADVAVWRPSDGTWYLSLSGSGIFYVMPWGLNGDKPVPGDFDGDGKTDLAVFRPTEGRWYIFNTVTGAFSTNDFGINGDTPVQADYSGDGKTDFAVYRLSNNTWYRQHTNDGTFNVSQWGLAGDFPTPGDFDGDGKTDVAVWRPSDGTWYVLKSTSGVFTQSFGTAGDTPTPSAFVY